MAIIFISKVINCPIMDAAMYFHCYTFYFIDVLATIDYLSNFGLYNRLKDDFSCMGFYSFILSCAKIALIIHWLFYYSEGIFEHIKTLIYPHTIS